MRTRAHALPSLFDRRESCLGKEQRERTSAVILLGFSNRDNAKVMTSKASRTRRRMRELWGNKSLSGLAGKIIAIAIFISRFNVAEKKRVRECGCPSTPGWRCGPLVCESECTAEEEWALTPSKPPSEIPRPCLRGHRLTTPYPAILIVTCTSFTPP